jgi:MFS transporter, ACS family, tartrate transporter
MNDLTTPSVSDEDLRRRVMRRVAWRLIPFLCLLYVFNILDRANLGVAKLTMQDDLGMSAAIFDFGFGLFYLGYLLFEVPSNLLLRKVGARRWIARIMMSWGLVSAGTMFVTGTTSFYCVRVLLGVAEAGFFPGIILYLTYWFPARERAKVIALFMGAIAFANILGNPISGAIMQYMNEVGGIKGWQWLFLLEGLPSVLLGVTVLFCLTDQPSEARWLAPHEREWLMNHMQNEETAKHQKHGADKLTAMFNPRVWMLICLYFTVAVGTNAASNHFPTLLKKQFEDLDKFQLGCLLALPHICALIGMTLLGQNSDRTGERRRHVAFAALVAAIGWGLSATGTSPELTLLGFCLAQTGMMSMLPVFWAIPTSFLSGAAAAGGVALINSVANIGGIVGASILGMFGLWSMAGILLAGSVIAVCLRPDERVSKLSAMDDERE